MHDTSFNKLFNSDNKGRLLEDLVVDIFTDLKFNNVKRQKSGSQYGYDVIAFKENKCWKAECKNLKKDATINDIAPKLIWHIDATTNIDKFVIVSTNGISNDLLHLLEKRLFSFEVEIWTDRFLKKLILSSPSACKRMEIQSNSSTSKFDKESPIVIPANQLEFSVNYPSKLPYSFDYFQEENRLIKTYTEQNFELLVRINNPTSRTIVVSELLVKTSKFKRTDSKRILRQQKVKGLMEPPEITFKPKNYLEGSSNVIPNKIIEVSPNSNEYLRLKLSNDFNLSEQGYYELIFEINCIDDGNLFSLLSTSIPLHVKNPRNNLSKLFVISRFYDRPVKTILDLPLSKWKLLQNTPSNKILCLGQTTNDLSQGIPTPKNWTINSLKGKVTKENGRKHLDINPNTKSKLVLDLGIQREEAMFSLKQDQISYKK